MTNDVEAVLLELGIKAEAFDHPPVFTCEEAERLLPEMPGVATKNIFLRDKKGTRHILLVVSDKKRVDLSRFAESIHSSRLSLGSPERLKSSLGVEPGSVSLLALIHDKEHRVEVFVDKEVWGAEALQCHPLVNSRTLVVLREGIERFLTFTGHRLQIVQVPEQVEG